MVPFIEIVIFISIYMIFKKTRVQKAIVYFIVIFITLYYLPFISQEFILRIACK